VMKTESIKLSSFILFFGSGQDTCCPEKRPAKAKDVY